MLSSAEHFVMKQIESFGGLPEMDQSIELIQEYLNGEYHSSKAKRLADWNPDKGELNELVLVIFTACLQNKKLTYQAISGMIAGRIALDEHIDAVKTAAECIALVSRTGLIDISRTGSGNYIMVSTQYALDGIPEPDRHEILYDQPPLFDKNWHEDYGHRVLGGRCNHHNEDICLDHINRMNAIPYQLNKPLLRKYEEAPTFALDTREKREQWQHFIRNSYRKYIEVSKKGNCFFLNHNADKRGRCYAQGYHLNTQGSSFKKAVIQLAEAEIVEV
jgi:hypothetical protein